MARMCTSGKVRIQVLRVGPHSASLKDSGCDGGYHGMIWDGGSNTETET